MAESTPIDPAGADPRSAGEPVVGPGEAAAPPRDPGAPIARDQIDPELVKLGRPRTQVGVITAAGLVLLCGVFLHRLGPDRRFAGSSPKPTSARVADVIAGKVATEQLLAVDAEPLTSLAIRTTTAKGSLGFRLAPARGTAERLWLVVSGDGEDPPAIDLLGPAPPAVGGPEPRDAGSPIRGYVGRLRALGDLPFAATARAYATAHPRPVFATAAAVRAGFASGTVTTVGGDAVTVADADVVELERVVPDAATIVASYNERLPDTAAWRAELAKAGVAPTGSSASDPELGQIRFSVAASVAETTTRLEAANLLDARIEPVTRHERTTWGALRISPPTGLATGLATPTPTPATPATGLATPAPDAPATTATAPVPDAQIDLVGLYVLRGIPDDAYAVVTGERPDDYWYVMPITIALAVILLVFAWALIRAVRRDLVPARAA